MNIFFKTPEIIRFTLVIIINSIISYLFFIALFVGMIFKNYYYFAVIINFIVPVSLSYCTMRLFVFNTKREVLPEYIKTVIVFLGGLLIGKLMSVMFPQMLGENINAIIFITIVVLFVYTYVALKKYAFNYELDFLGRRFNG